MPPKKSNIGRKASPTKRKSQQRDEDSHEQQEKRPRSASTNVISITESRIDTQRENRLLTKRAYAANVRSSETDTQREARLAYASMHASHSRSTETDTHRKSRLSYMSTHASNVRSTETVAQRQRRLADKRAHSLNVRSMETDAQSQRRLADKRAHSLNVRSMETDAQSQMRLADKRAHSLNVRSMETDAQSQRRLADKRAHSLNVRSMETDAQSQRRLADKRAHMNNVRSTETLSQRDERLQLNAAALQNARLLPWRGKENAAFRYSSNIDYTSNPTVSIGGMTIQCNHCSALKWKGESKGMCCGSGKVDLPSLEVPPEPLRTLLISDTRESKDFRANIRKYNGAFQMTSFGTTGLDAMGLGYMPTFKIQGQVYHLAGSLLPEDGEDPKFLQMYFVGDENEQARLRGSHQPGVKPDTVLQLQRMLHEHNEYVRTLKSVMDTAPTNEYKVRIFENRTPHGEHIRRYNAPVTDDVGMVIVGDEDAKTRDIIIHTKGHQLKRITETHRSYDALQYPLLFWKGEDGYAIKIPQKDPVTGELKVNKTVSANDFYAYRIMYRRDSFNTILRCSHLFHQFITDMYAKIEGERLAYFRNNQKKLRSDEYIHLKDAIRTDKDVTDIGKIYILPSSFTGGPRYMHERTQDAMTYVRHHGRPDLFVTFTCNPKWKEIQDELFPHQTPQDRHDLLARVFQQKLTLLMNLIVKGCIFGKTLCHMYTVEWQKRGLPHVHILLWLKEKLRPNQTDDTISAEIPDPDSDPVLFEMVTRNMIHGPCGHLNPKSPCMIDNKCSKGYPKTLVEETMSNSDGYPQYRRRKLGEGGFETNIKIRGEEHVIDNRWVVPHNRLLIKIFNAHINVEICNSVKSIKYICKYVNKGSDQACIGMEKKGAIRDEIARHELGRYISSNEGCWHVLGFHIHERHPAVVKLSVHLPDGQRVYFTESNFRQRAEAPPSTTLTAFFELCTRDEFAKTIFYYEVPGYYTWVPRQHKFQRRIQGKPVEDFPSIKKSEVLGRVYTIHPNNFECFCMRLLLHVIRGPTCFDDLKTFEGVVCSTFQECAFKWGLLEDDAHWNSTLEDASIGLSASRLRTLFAMMIQFCHISNPKTLWLTHRENLSEDVLLQTKRDNPGVEVVYNEAIYNRALVLLEDKVLEIGGKLLKKYGMYTPDRDEQLDTSLSREVLQETTYDLTALQNMVDENEPLITDDQRVLYNDVLRMIHDQSGGIVFVDAPGGTGKTFVLNLLLDKVRLDRNVALAVAFSGIAATLLHGGRTAHSTFKLPLNLALEETPTCGISKGTGMAKVLQQCKLIVWDESTMMHKRGFEALDRTLRDIRNKDELMGGVLLLLAGDFRQTLPIITRGTAADEIKACIKTSYLWRSVQRYSLSTNMRVHLFGDETAQEFANELMKIGNGETPRNEDGSITIQPNVAQVVETVDVLKTSVFPDLGEMFATTDYETWMRERAILSPTNDIAADLNFKLLQELPGPEMSYWSIDKACGDCEEVDYPTEFLNTLNPPQAPPHKLTLKVGAPIIMLRNMNPPKMCNGTRLIVKRLMPNLIEATIITGCAKGEVVDIPRIPIIPTDMAIEFKRMQFPLKMCFAMSINRAQGQSLKVVGVQLESPCFSHGQLYVASSRVSSANNLFMFAPGGKTVNVVYPRALQ